MSTVMLFPLVERETEKKTVKKRERIGSESNKIAKDDGCVVAE